LVVSVGIGVDADTFDVDSIAAFVEGNKNDLRIDVVGSDFNDVGVCLNVDDADAVDANDGVVFVGAFIGIIIFNVGTEAVSFCLAAFCINTDDADTIVAAVDVVLFIVFESIVIVVVAAFTLFVSVISAPVGVA
jgi:hypothetical protein